MSDAEEFKDVVRELEEEPVLTEAVYELENIKTVYGGEEYTRVMSAVHDEEYGEALSILDELEEEYRGENP